MKLLTDLYTRYQARRMRENAMFAILLGACCMIFAVVAIVGSIVVNTFNTIEGVTVRQQYGEIIANSCNPMPSSTVSDDNLSSAEAPRKVILLRADTSRRHRWHAELPSQWQAENQAEVGLIGCVEEDRVTLETCEYQRPDDEGGSFTIRIDREQYELTLTLINPDTGRRIASQTALGTEPEPCPPDEDVTHSDTYRGEQVEFSEFSAWIESYVFGEN